MTLLTRIKESVDYIHSICDTQPEFGIVLGSGLGSFANEISVESKISFSSIPHFPVSGVEGHKGHLLFAKINSVTVVIMQGRVHFYEGFSMEEITYPIRVMKYLGIHSLLLTNASGGIHPEFEIGDIMMINDHINLMPNPLIGSNSEDMGPQFPDMSQAYDPALMEQASRIASEQGIILRKGVYVGVTGPTYETPAEYKYFRIIGGDAVGMSTVPEVIVARQMSLKCFALSVITDLGIPGKLEFVSHDMVQKAAEKSGPRVAVLLNGLIANSASIS